MKIFNDLVKGERSSVFKNYLVVCSQMDVGVGGSESPEGCFGKGDACLTWQVPFEEDIPDFLNMLLDLLAVKVSVG